eukprot:Awhi_evm1s5965
MGLLYNAAQPRPRHNENEMRVSWQIDFLPKRLKYLMSFKCTYAQAINQYQLRKAKIQRSGDTSFGTGQKEVSDRAENTTVYNLHKDCRLHNGYGHRN